MPNTSALEARLGAAQQLQLRLQQQLSAVRAEARAIQLQLDTEHRGSGGRARAALAHGTSAGRLGPYEVASAPAPFEFFGTDVADDGALARAARAVAHNGEIIVVCGDGSAYASPTALNTVRVCESSRAQATPRRTPRGAMLAKDMAWTRQQRA